MDLFSITYFGEIIIFVVSKDQTFRIRCTLMNPEQFLILVPYLILILLRTQENPGSLGSVPVLRDGFGFDSGSSIFGFRFGFGSAKEPGFWVRFRFGSKHCSNQVYNHIHKDK